MNVFDLVAKISLDTSDYTGALNEASEETQSVGSRIGKGLKTAGKVGAVAIGAVGVAGAAMAKELWNGTKELAAYGDNIDKMSQKMGMSAEAYQEWDAVMQHSGTSMEAMKSSMKTLANAAESGSDAFEQLGISQEEIANMSQEELFGRTIEALQNVEDTTTRTYLAGKTLGRGATELGALLNTSAEDTQAMKDRVHELGGVMSDDAVKAAAAFQDNMQDLQTAIGGVKRSIVDDFLPGANDMMEGFTMMIAGEDGAEDKLDSGMEKITEAAGGALDRISEIMDKLLPRISEAIGKLLPKLVSLGSKIVLQLAEGIIKSLPEIVSGLVSAATDILQVIATDIAPKLPDIAVDLVTTLAETLIDNLDLIIDAALKIVLGLADGLVKAVPKLVAKIPTITGKLVKAILNAIPMIIKAGVELFVSLVKNVPAIIAGIVEAIPELIQAILEAFEEVIPGLSGIFEGAWEAIKAVWDVVAPFFKGIWEAIKAVFSVVISVLGGFFKGAWEAIKLVWNVAAAFFQGVWNAISAVFSVVAEVLGGFFSAAWDAIKAVWDTVTGVFEGIWKGIKDIFSPVAEVLGGFFDDAAKLVGEAFDKIVQFAQACKDAVEAIFASISITDDLERKVNRLRGSAAGGSANRSVTGRAVGGVIRKGEVALLEGTGAEAVVPLDRNRKWVRAVANEFALAGGGGMGGSDIVIPVYIGNERLDTLVVKANQANNYRSGGRG